MRSHPWRTLKLVGYALSPILLSLLLWTAPADNPSNEVKRIALAPTSPLPEEITTAYRFRWEDTDKRLVLPVVFHLQRSRRWQSPETLEGVLAETQRILDQANIELQPRFLQTDAATADIDIYLVPQLQHQGRSVNGISYPWGDREIYVRDDVSLEAVADGRPHQPLPLPKYWQERGDRGDVWVDAERAEQARTIAHELGHQLGLSHRLERTFLEASGTTGWQLDGREVAIMRGRAIAVFGAQPV